jgi:hypothetical protein
MKYFIALAAVFYSLTMSAQEIPAEISAEQSQKAVDVAVKWTQMLTQGKDLEAVLNITAVPFAKDGKDILLTRREVKDFYLEVVKDKGQREAPKLTGSIFSYRNEILDECIPMVYAIVAVDFEYDGDKERVLVSVLMAGEDYKVTGFRD